MLNEAGIRQALIKAHGEKRLITCRIPDGGDIMITLESHMVDQAMAAWKAMPEPERDRTIGSVRRAIKRTIKRLKKDRATQSERDALAADIALWLGHELLFSDGERHLIKGPDPSDLMKPLAGGAQ